MCTVCFLVYTMQVDGCAHKMRRPVTASKGVVLLRAHNMIPCITFLMPTCSCQHCIELCECTRLVVEPLNNPQAVSPIPAHDVV